MAFWAGTGSFIYPAPPAKSIPLQLSTLNCTVANSTEALVTAAPTVAPERYFSHCYHLNLRFAKCATPACSQMTQQLQHELNFAGTVRQPLKHSCCSSLVAFVTSSQAFAGRHLVLPVLPVLQCHWLRGLCHHRVVDKLYNRLVLETYIDTYIYI